jgi:hypothetical protein
MSQYVIDTDRLSLYPHGHAEVTAKLDAYPPPYGFAMRP